MKSEQLIVSNEQLNTEGRSHSIIQEKSYAFALRIVHLHAREELLRMLYAIVNTSKSR